jgi:hypothetical protein
MSDFVVSTNILDTVYTLYFGEHERIDPVNPYWWRLFCNGHQIMWGCAPTFDKAVVQGSSKLVELKDRITIPVAA